MVAPFRGIRPVNSRVKRRSPPIFRGEQRSPRLFAPYSSPSPRNRYAESGEEIVLDLSSISDRVKQTSVGSHLYRDNSCNFGSFPVPPPSYPPTPLPPPFLLDFTYAYAQIAEADRGGFDCTARDRRFINALSARRRPSSHPHPPSISRSEVKSPTLR